MNKNALIVLLFASLFFTSCIPTKDLIYLQGEESAQVQAMNPVAQKPYRLQINDVLSITIKASDVKLVEVFKQTNVEGSSMRDEKSLYFDGFIIDDHGNIRVPVLNEVNVLGYTLDEVRQTIEKKLLDEYFTEEANLFVTVKLAGFRYTTNGEVGKPGTQTLYQERVNVMEAIANSGDITITGDRKSVVIIRQLPQGTEMHTLDLTNRDVMQSPYYYLQPNDYIYVKPLPQKSLGTGTTAMQSLTAIITVLSLLGTITVLLTR
ncbi:polysaccharide biosynthesis/export family protein [Flavobacterium silvaticum]|uniref:Sugar transporter n=1 Tax=Flavobacterium silvaticum TaxID=1852020 RepID=A0A972FQJ5_9FLAO|nr:polysaccharide biosynthesis/export family protein [Flavobacterium silvaticum]NMH29530.1 sugar transporter [Flavobacterium silvaticum]